MSDELKKLLGEVNTAFSEYKKANDERLKAIETKGKADPVLTENVAKLEAAIATKDAEYKAKLEAIETAMKRTQTDPENKGGPSQESKAQKDAFFRLIRKGDERLSDLERKTLQVSDDSQGGFLVPADTTGRIIQKIFDTSPMRQYASIATISTDSLEGAVDTDECEGGYVGEMGSRATTGNPTIGKWSIPVHEIYAKPRTTQKVLDDAAYDLEGWLIKKIGEKLGRIENREFVLGNSGKIRGFLTYDIVTTLSGDDYTAKKKVQYTKTGVSGGFAATPNGGDVLIDMQQMLKDQYRAKAAWGMNRFTVGETRKLKDSQGRYLWAPGIEVGKPSTLLGLPIAEYNDMPSISANSLSIALADWSEAYQIVDRQGITILRNPYIDMGFVLFYTRKRTGGDLLNFEALKLLKFAA